MVGPQPWGGNSGTNNLGNTYTCPVGQSGSTACQNYLAGAKNFAITIATMVKKYPYKGKLNLSQI